MKLEVYQDNTGFAPKHMQWHAIDSDAYDGVADGNTMMGYGSTEIEAVRDLVEQIEHQIQSRESYRKAQAILTSTGA